ncbi:YceI family protein [Pedobacter sp. HDW13]|uniref:YceI family protein n=1 Tax=unclassified Pedobacter TaxID=2628915 RepID=UPI000F598FAC|nr:MULTISPECIES: YceI family protein [unclassified Pedobacter]QIL39008.1 YceI family protein [Pedobacter sp. HDW13]RQO72648.1 YceI family protein [Pedobacter sp. KBW01]
MKKLLITLILVSAFAAVHAQMLISKDAIISFFSKAPMEDIDAISKTAVSGINIKTGEIIFKINNNSFQFKKKLMQEHFNENYMESDTYPTSEFKGKIIDPVDFSKLGTYNVVVKGNLQIHGVTKTYQTQAKITVTSDAVTANAAFKVKLEDHKIKIPTIVIAKIAEVVDVKINAVYPTKN